MNKPATLPTTLPSNLDLDAVRWMRLVGGPEFDYHIDYAYAVVSADTAQRRVDMLFKWKPNAYCHYHRHLGEQTITVLRGEQHIFEERSFETIHKIRKAGFTGKVPDGETHMERSGPEGMTVMFNIHAPDGRLFEILDKAGNTLMTVTIDDAVEHRLGEAE